MSAKQQNSTIHISLTPTLVDFVEELVESGLYGNTSEVVREALREKYENKEIQKLAKLRQAVKIGLDQAKNEEFDDANLEDLLKKARK